MIKNDKNRGEIELTVEQTRKSEPLIERTSNI